MEGFPSERASRKAIILHEAARLFREKGYRSATLRELARRSGVKGGSIYHHFASKQEILYRIMDRTMDHLLHGLAQETRGAQDPVEGLRRAIAFHIRYHLENRNETHVTDTELKNLENEYFEQVVQKRRAYERMFMEILEEGSRKGRMNVESIRLASIAVLQMCTGVPAWFNERGPLSVEDVVEKYVDFVCWGVLGRIGSGWGRG